MQMTMPFRPFLSMRRWYVNLLLVPDLCRNVASPLDCGVYSARTQRTIADVSPFVQAYTDTPDYTVMTFLNRVRPIYSLWTDIPPQDSDTNPNTTASSVAGDAVADGHRRRSEATQLRKSILSKKHGRLDESKVRSPMLALFFTP